MQPLFQFQNAGEVAITLTTSASDLLTNPLTKFKFDNSAFPIGSGSGEFDFSQAVINGSESLSVYSSDGIRPGLLYARYISKELTGLATNITQFNDLAGIRSSINTKLNTAIDSKFDALTGAGEKSIVTVLAPDTDLTNPTFRLMTQIDNRGRMDARFTPAVLSEAIPVFRAVPLISGDKFIFKIRFTPAAGQKDVTLLDTKTQPNVINPIDAIIRITVTDA
jgi:hypothetical protein